ncbi:MAG: aminotransferase class I/II-fold pyridoxal phosphate-dependent enzyme [SAR202 cluster bacterium]|jgi:LL-diaminopimelate aminotransferase|nr:LL-diaminopimelate aminotransferase [Chloroflexota bacterium]MDP6420289.1 LL-diaminopimelate aminotransferase [SAR202 cluster bacterium]HAL48423.1 LL-diaminopimelate aminotransferase [Dehalococcoidia bacterium]MDP6665003.1 LL-diaminopimelate aminotransferase [SAR202 cluster bacterium]MDP6798618.1 LL-diaminopimelate aminotransferase [SAR202 cluster bacterium]|tara:strand:- start:1198 stop:2361 length:1164 start_codon:yes stop_codon:yes gene_type:complete
MKFASRVEKIPPYLFVEISRKIAQKKAEGIEVISFGIGDPDLPTPDPVVERLRQTAGDGPNHRYPETEGLPEFRSAVAAWYNRRFGISVDPVKEVISLIGAKEGIGHAALCFIEPGDIALVPDPGYPVYSVGTWFAGGECHWMPLREENGWLPDLEAIPADVADRAKVMWLNYPNNPTGAVADIAYFEQVVEFARKHDLAVMHDACYTDVVFDGYSHPSFLETPGAMEVGVEFHSLSKTYNMTGWRIGMAVGNADMINAMLIVKSNLDSGVPQAIQEMGIEALETTDEWLDGRNAIYQNRRDKVLRALETIGLHVDPPKASLYVWARVPEGQTSASFTEKILDECAIVVTPGNGYGQYGEGYIRLSLTIGDADLDRGLERLIQWSSK